MRQVNIYEVKTNLSKYLALLKEGKEDEIIICSNGVPCAKLSPIVSKLDKGLSFGTGKKYLKTKDEGNPFVGDKEIEDSFLKENTKW
jgi:antitoxin (DNA-binding transcriptional repressor) of toxin-antitoxin stability system